MKIERRKTRTAEVYTSSLNDIMFFLLLFFLIISTMVTPATIKVLLPKSSTAEKVTTKRNVNLVVTADLRYFIDDKQLTKEEIEPALRSILQKKKDDEDINVLLQADKSLTLQEVVSIIDIGNRVNIKMVLFTEKT